MLKNVFTFGGHGDLSPGDIGVTAEVRQVADGTLSHHRLPAERTVVDHLQHDGRSVHLIFRKELKAEQSS